MIILLLRYPTATRDKYAEKEAGQFPCLADYGEMINPKIALVGFPGKRTDFFNHCAVCVKLNCVALLIVSDGFANYDMSAAMTITFAFNDVDEQKNKDAMLWEVELIKYLKAYKGRNIMVFL